jgi:hypothetical protein
MFFSSESRYTHNDSPLTFREIFMGGGPVNPLVISPLGADYGGRVLRIQAKSTPFESRV